jgi:hypothetical protein
MDAAFSEPQTDDERRIKTLIDEFNAQARSRAESVVGSYIGASARARLKKLL